MLVTTTLETVATKSLSLMTTSMMVMPPVTMPTVLLLPVPALGLMLALVLTTPMNLAVVSCVRWCRQRWLAFVR